MKAFFKFASVVCTAAILFSSCSKSSDEGKMIPSNSVFVAHVNTSSLSEKVSWNEIKQTSWYKKAYSDPAIPDWRKKILENPTVSGIDFDKNLTFFASKGTGDDFYIVAEGAIKNEKDFEQFNKNFDSIQTVRKEGDISLITLKDRNVVGWNGKNFAYVMSSKTTSSQLYKWNDSASLQPPVLPEDNSAGLSAFCVKLFSLKDDSSLAKNEKFADLLKEKGDLHVWQNTEEIMKNIPNMGMLGMLKLDAFFKSNISTYTVNFDKGKIEVAQKGYASKELTDVLKKYMSGNINTDMIKNIPSNDIVAVIAANFKPEGIKALIQLTGADGFVNTFTQKIGFNLDDVSKSTNGDWLITLSDFKMKQDSFNYKDDVGNDIGSGKYEKPVFNYLFSVGIGDKASLQKIINSASNMLSQQGNDSLLNNKMNDKVFALSNSSDFASKYLAGGNNKFDFTDKISGHPVGVFIDLHKIMALSATTKTNDDAKAMIDQSLKTWNNITMTGGDFTNGAFTANTEINMLDANTNSLKQLNTYVDEMFKLNEARKGSGLNEKKMDSLLTPPPIDTVKVK